MGSGGGCMPEHRHSLATTVRSNEEGLMVKDIIYGRLDLGRGGLIRRMKRGGGGVFLNGEKDYLTRRVRAGGDEIKIVFFTKRGGLISSPRTFRWILFMKIIICWSSINPRGWWCIPQAAIRIKHWQTPLPIIGR